MTPLPASLKCEKIRNCEQSKVNFIVAKSFSKALALEYGSNGELDCWKQDPNSFAIILTLQYSNTPIVFEIEIPNAGLPSFGL